MSLTYIPGNVLLDIAERERQAREIMTMVISKRNLNFGEALDALKVGGSVSRGGWYGVGQWLRLQTPHDDSEMSLPYIYAMNGHGESAPWVPIHADLLANDWRVVQ